PPLLPAFPTRRSSDLNSRTAYVKVKSNKRRYVLIAGGPNPDVAFLKRLLGADPNIEVKSFVQRGGPEFLEGKLDAGAFKDAEARSEEHTSELQSRGHL